jgi:hypothetical protein
MQAETGTGRRPGTTATAISRGRGGRRLTAPTVTAADSAGPVVVIARPFNIAGMAMVPVVATSVATTAVSDRTVAMVDVGSSAVVMLGPPTVTPRAAALIPTVAARVAGTCGGHRHPETTGSAHQQTAGDHTADRRAPHPRAVHC